MNARLRKVTRNRGQFPSEQAALKVLYLAVRNLEHYRRPNVGIRSSGWKQAPRLLLCLGKHVSRESPGLLEPLRELRVWLSVPEP